MKPPGLPAKFNRSDATPPQNDDWISTSTQIPVRIPSIHRMRGHTRSPDRVIINTPHTARTSGTRKPANPKILNTPQAAHAPTGPM